MKATLIIPTYKRNSLLLFGLYSVHEYLSSAHLEIIILDNGPKDDALPVAQSFNAKYIWVKERKGWSGPGHSLNVGVKAASTDIVILSCPEIWHMNDCIKSTLEEFELNDSKIMVMPTGKDDENKECLDYLLTKYTDVSPNLYDRCCHLNCKVPFLLGMYKKDYIDIGGYDEDFMEGVGRDDRDFVERMLQNGCRYIETPGKIVHLWHERQPDDTEARKYNIKLYEQRHGQIIRNQNKEWGIL